MGGSLLFVRGTGAHDISGSLGRIREGVAQIAEIQDVRVHGAQWGIAVGPKDLDVTPALPPEVASRDLGDEPTEHEVALQEWNLLITDPLLELRLLAALPGGTGDGGVIVAADPADVVLYERLSSLQVSQESLVAAGIDAPMLAVAGPAVAASLELPEAAGAVGDPDDADLLAATARAVVATVLQSWVGAAATGPVVCRDGAARDRFLAAVLQALAPAGTKGVMRKLVGKLVTPLATRLATRVAVRRRGRLMDPTTDFVRDIAFYVKRGDKVRDFIAAEVARLEPPVVILGHILGEVAAVDLMSGPGRPQAFADRNLLPVTPPHKRDQAVHARRHPVPLRDPSRISVRNREHGHPLTWDCHPELRRLSGVVPVRVAPGPARRRRAGRAQRTCRCERAPRSGRLLFRRPGGADTGALWC